MQRFQSFLTKSGADCGKFVNLPKAELVFFRGNKFISNEGALLVIAHKPNYVGLIYHSTDEKYLTFIDFWKAFDALK